MLTDKAEAIATFYAERELDSYDYYIEAVEVESHEVVTQKLTRGEDDNVVAAAITDLGLSGYVALATVSSLANSYENIFAFLAQETTSDSAP